MNIYIAGPLFTRVEKTFNFGIAAALLQKGYKDFFLPQDFPIDFASETWQHDTFMANVEHIDEMRDHNRDIKNIEEHYD